MLKILLCARDGLLGYYDVFPPKKMNVKIANLPMKDKSGKPLENEGVPVLRSALVATKNIKTGELIYKACIY